MKRFLRDDVMEGGCGENLFASVMELLLTAAVSLAGVGEGLVHVRPELAPNRSPLSLGPGRVEFSAVALGYSFSGETRSVSAALRGMASDMLLYWGSGSPPCWRVMIALEEKQLSGYRSKLLSFDKKEHQSDEVKALNPRAQLPTFKHGEIVVNESYAACFYLEVKRQLLFMNSSFISSVFKSQGTRLLPEDPSELALVYQRVFESQNLQQKMYEVAFYDWVFPEGERHESAVKRKRESLIEELKLWEGYLEKTVRGSYLAGRSFSMADVVCFPVVAYFPRLHCPPERCPRLMEYYHMLKERASIKASWPPGWIENPVGPESLKNL
ncbi:hypothetical protein DNTS_032897 [Danionella cerebrum]|uniref:Uncharacterized protein n=1 Tax=Danionella cerebrum TaxID=2873325 RepID=A0A553R5B9_9TELE|nr:hypothetical protein DNTS_032897 [Danionella translucida]